jgi:hypothetical protein
MLCFSREPVDMSVYLCSYTIFIQFRELRAYKRKSAVAACSDFGLVGVDKDSRMAKRTAAAVAGDDSLLCPSHGLFVNQLNGSVWLGLYFIINPQVHPLHLGGAQFQLSLWTVLT